MADAVGALAEITSELTPGGVPGLIVWDDPPLWPPPQLSRVTENRTRPAKVAADNRSSSLLTKRKDPEKTRINATRPKISEGNRTEGAATASEGAVVVIFAVTDVVVPLRGTLEGLNEHAASAGMPEQLKVIAPVKCRVGDIDTTNVAV